MIIQLCLGKDTKENNLRKAVIEISLLHDYIQVIEAIIKLDKSHMILDEEDLMNI